MKTYALLWGIGLVMVIVGFAASFAVTWTSWSIPLVVGGFLLGAAGAVAFTKRDQQTAA